MVWVESHEVMKEKHEGFEDMEQAPEAPEAPPLLCIIATSYQQKRQTHTHSWICVLT